MACARLSLVYDRAVQPAARLATRILQQCCVEALREGESEGDRRRRRRRIIESDVR